MNPIYFATNCFSAGLQELRCFLAFLLFELIFSSNRQFVGRKCLPDEGDHLFVVSGQQPSVVQHLIQKASCVCSSGKAENIDLGSGAVMSHEESISPKDMLVEGDSQGRVNKLAAEKLTAASQRVAAERSRRDLGSNTRYSGVSTYLQGRQNGVWYADSSSLHSMLVHPYTCTGRGETFISCHHLA